MPTSRISPTESAHAIRVHDQSLTQIDESDVGSARQQSEPHERSHSPKNSHPPLNPSLSSGLAGASAVISSLRPRQYLQSVKEEIDSLEQQLKSQEDSAGSVPVMTEQQQEYWKKAIKVQLQQSQ